MATSIFFTESKDFKLIKDRILNHEDNYLVYVYADTTNIRIPKELIMQLPRYGNNLIWVDTADMDSSDLSHHIVLTIGQLINPEEEMDFYIVSKSSKLDKTIIFLRNQGIPAEMITPGENKATAEKPKGTSRRGRPRKVQPEDQQVVKTGKRGRPKKERTEVSDSITVSEEAEGAVTIPAEPKKRGRKKIVTELSISPVAVPAQPKKRGRPVREKVVEAAAEAMVAEAIPAEPKKRGRKKIEKPLVEEKTKKGGKVSVETLNAAGTTNARADKNAKKIKKETKEKKAKAVKEVTQRKPRVDKVITEAMIKDKLDLYTTTDTNVVTVMTKLFSLKKVARPKFEIKLINMIKDITLEDDTVAEGVLTQLQKMQVLELSGEEGRIFYKD